MGNELILNNDQTIVYDAIVRLDVPVEPKKLSSESLIALAVVFVITSYKNFMRTVM